MTKTLGLDLGTNSIGWAVVKDETILGTGVRIFKEGVANLGDGKREVSNNSQRREFRGSRRQNFRRKIRKKLLLKKLKEYKMCPELPDDMNSWFRLNPYNLRNKALVEKISLLELGRIFYHMSQRRGFLSNSRNASANETGKIYDGYEGKTGISETQDKIKNKTLGAYLYSISQNMDGNDNVRIRNRFTTRKMYIDEFNQIWRKQSEFNKDLTDVIRKIIGGSKSSGDKEDGILFYQRPLRSQKDKIGNCSLEKDKPRCPISTIKYELFRMYQFINTIECNGKKISEEDREIIKKIMLRKEKPKFQEVRKKLKKNDDFYKFNYKDDDSLPGTFTISNLCSKKYFGDKWFFLSEKEQEDIWHVLFFFDDIKKLKEYAISKWDFSEEQADKVSKFHLKQGYSSLSRKAINNILPFLKLGYQYDVAVILGGIKNAFGKRWTEYSEKQFIFDNIPGIVRSGVKGGFFQKLKDFLLNYTDLEENRFNKLYHHSVDLSRKQLLDKLPTGKEADKEIDSIRNPVVIQCLYELRKVVNKLIDKYGSFDEIKIELARDLKVSKIKRNEIRRSQKEKEKKNDEIKKELTSLGQIVSEENILKYKLWEECNHICPYSYPGDNDQISVEDLFSGRIQIEHIFPYSRSLDDSYMNKTLCFDYINREKGNKTPYEYFSSKGEWEEIIKPKLLSIFHDSKDFPNRYQKFKRLVKEKYDEDFISRQLNDTRYISSEAKKYMSLICDKIIVFPGNMTSKLRYYWGLNSIIGTAENHKSREDNRHHAIDALTIACSKVSFLQELSKWNRYRNRTEQELSESFPPPWKDFYYDAKDSIEKILISYKHKDSLITKRKVVTEKNGKKYINKSIAARGQLHNETIYGKRLSPYDGNFYYHVRKPLSLLSEAMISKIVDPVIKEIITERLTQIGLKIDLKSGKVITKTKEEKEKFKSAFSEPLYMKTKSGKKFEIKKVRLRENSSNALNLRTGKNQHVEPGNNHHVVIYKDRQGKLRDSCVTFLGAVKCIKDGKPVYSLPEDGQEIVEVLKENDMFIIGLDVNKIGIDNLKKETISDNLYRVQKVSKCDYSFRKHIASTQNNANEHIRIASFKKWEELKPYKIKISAIGES